MGASGSISEYGTACSFYLILYHTLNVLSSPNRAQYEMLEGIEVFQSHFFFFLFQRYYILSPHNTRIHPNEKAICNQATTNIPPQTEKLCTERVVLYCYLVRVNWCTILSKNAITHLLPSFIVGRR